ncbi:MAG: EF-hand domain-containing protein, partial [Planctomycetes bacterium]|nr:EF-hand domain-containing protein [Planctomycetota bacterium]
KEGKNGLTTLTYDFYSLEQLQDFYPVGGGGTTIDWVEKKPFFKLKGEVRFLAANPFESRIAINGVVPNGGYNAAAPNVNVALWTEENDRVTAPRAFNYNAWRESNETGEPPADYFGLGRGYKPEVSLGGILGEGRLGGLARTLTGFLPGYLRESSFALLAGEHGVGLHSRRDEKIWSQPVGSLLRPGTIRFSISMENSALKWKVNSKSLGYRNSLALARLAEKIPHAGSFNIFTNNSTVYFSSLEITGQLSKKWAAGLAKSIAARELKKLDSSFGRGADGKAGGAKSDTSSGAGGGKGTGSTPGPGSNQGGASSGGLKGVMERFDKNGDGKLDENERKAFQDLLREGLGSEPDSSPEKKEPAGSAGQGSSS